MPVPKPVTVLELITALSKMPLQANVKIEADDCYRTPTTVNESCGHVYINYSIGLNAVKYSNLVGILPPEPTHTDTATIRKHIENTIRDLKELLQREL